MTLQGSIDSFPLADVLRLLGSTNKSGELVLDGDRGTASMWLDDGGVVAGVTSLVSATPGGGTLGAVLFDMLRYEQGSFTFDAASMCADPIPPVSVDELLEQGERDMAEWHAISEVIPRITCELELVAELVDREVIVDRRLWSGIVAIGGGASVDAMAGRLSLSDLPAMRLAADLITAGLVLVSMPAPVATMASSSLHEGDFITQAFGEPARAEVPAETAEASAAAAFAMESLASPPFVPVDDADLDALFDAPSSPLPDPQDLAQQMAGLSPHAARAIAAATANDDSVSQDF